MGNCYSVTMMVKFKDKDAAVADLKAFVTGGKSKRGSEIEFSLADHAKDGVIPDSWDNLVRIFLADWEGQRVQFGEWRRNKLHETDRHGFLVYNNGFSAMYSWECVMLEMFERIAPHLEDGSTLEIDMDEGVDECVVKDGKFVQVK